ncbi:trypsin-like peptidase domain-containing protein [Actinomycetospora sp. NBRC 106378]|uniref:trypsin-like peptidase domain-containing protein n=1 Tax=Actinomycetospora sp. NBRC 106378 TaxID=3032208 RepID=UPI0024A12B58|nr:trypsin-like peptidase domain-containing protein [Actinomycetospora sp. NBRC 106378]GLZ56393.1 hypothetical protein Acsp07_60100 [Actinomycetospora sp. NBRC 106378]
MKSGFPINSTARALLFCTAIIQSDGPRGRQTGTCFFYEASETTEHNIPALVTNRHIVEECTGGTIRLVRADDEGNPLLGQEVTVKFSGEDWTHHPSSRVDLSVAAAGPFLNALQAQGQAVCFRMVARAMAPSESQLETFDVFESITFVGYPNALHDRVNLTPIGRRGFTATPIQLNYGGDPSFLIDASVFRGSSGSPVFSLSDGVYREGNTVITGDRVLFLGVVARAHLVKGASELAPELGYEQMLDLGVVFNWISVEEAVRHKFRELDISS